MIGGAVGGRDEHRRGHRLHYGDGSRHHSRVARQERPRERLLNEGEKALSNRELLAILLGSGAPRQSALTLAEQLLRKAESLRGLAAMDVEELRK